MSDYIFWAIIIIIAIGWIRMICDEEKKKSNVVKNERNTFMEEKKSNDAKTSQVIKNERNTSMEEKKISQEGKKSIEDKKSMEEKKSQDAMPACDEGTVQSVRDMHPANYILKIDSFSSLLEMLEESGHASYDSEIFEACGFTWKLSLYPNGDEERNGKGHISLYLSLEDTNDLALGWDVYADYKFFVLDQIRDKYSIFQGKQVRRFRETKKEWGFARLLSRNVFDDATKGYLIQDKCMFGVEIFVCNYIGRGECLGRPEKLISNLTYIWTITNYSTLTEREYESPVFNIGNSNWKLYLYPKGIDGEEDERLSVFLELEDQKNTPKVYATYKMSIKDKNNVTIAEKHEATRLFSAAAYSSWGWFTFLSLKDIEDASGGFLVQDTLIVEVDFSRISTVKNFY